MVERVEKLLDAMALGPREGLLVYNPSNMFYLSGYKGEGLVLVCRGGCAVVTDFRYTEQAEKEAPGFRVCMVGNGKNHEAIAGELCGEYGVDTLYFEKDYVTVSTFDACKAAMPSITWKSTQGAVEKQRQIKDAYELDCVRQACRITGEAFERVLSFIKEGMTEKEIALHLEFDMMTHGATAPSFSTIVAAGEHGSLPHAVPGEYRVRKGDMITMDFGARFGNYCADMTRTVALGQPSDEMRKVYGIVLEAQKMSQDAVCAGKNCFDIDAIARNHIYQSGYEGRFGHGLGHGVGIDIHESPRFSTGCHDILQVGQVMTVEPGIYLPGVGGVRIENSVAVEENGCEVLTTPSRELMIL